MKKFWNLMLAALVVLGAVACSENGDELTPQVEREGLSFEATIIMDDTRTSLEKDETSGKWNTVWSGDETLVVTDGTNSYDFVYRADKGGKFSCNADGVESLIGQPIEVRLKHSASTTIDSKAGMAGGSLYASVDAFDPATGVELHTENSFFRFSSVHVGTLTASEAVFYYDGSYHESIELRPGENIWVAFEPYTGTLSYSINGVDQKKLDTAKEFAAKKIYPLGTFETGASAFSISGCFNNWSESDAVKMYKIPNSNTYVSYDVDLYGTHKDKGFKFINDVNEDGMLYLKPNSNWTQAEARFAAYFFIKNADTNNTWVGMTDTNNDGTYEVKIPQGKGYNTVIFCRMNPGATANNWNNKWNQTGDLTIPTNGNNLFTVPNGAWDGSTTSWSKHDDKHWLGGVNSNNWTTGWSNNAGSNITVTDFSTTYDIYFSKGNDQNWGYEYYYAVCKSGSVAPALK
ncbi:MAG: hypothetical protein J6V05_02770 [Alistipes sp.]|nr:hypothetical protein [Alistipes sp.]